MAHSFFPPPLFGPHDPEIVADAQATASAALELDRILYDFPPRDRSNSQTSVYQDCHDEYQSSDGDSCQDSEENTTSLGPTSTISLDQVDVSRDGTIVSGSSRDAVIAYEVQDHLMLPEYPDTDENGVLHIIHVSKNPLQNVESSSREINEIFTQLMSSVQFSTKHLKSAKQIYTKLLQKDPKDKESRSWHRSYQCTGIQHCHQVHPSLITPSPRYNRVKPSLFLELQFQAAKPVYSSIRQEIEQRTREGQKPRVWIRNGTTFIGCPNHSPEQTWHYAQAVSNSSARVDIGFLKLLCEKDGMRAIGYNTRDCHFVLHRAAKRQHCDSVHADGIGRITKTECPVRIDLYIPCSWDRFPFYIVVSRGSHSHFPPLPTKLPYQIGQEIAAAIHAQDILGLTARKLMVSPTFAKILHQHGDSALRYIHKSLHIEDKVTALIHKQRLLYYPQGTSFAGVWREYQFDLTKNNDEQWIREVFFFDEQREHYLIICWLNTYVYAFMNLETRAAYRVLFEKIFKTLGDVGRKPVQWAYQLGGDDSCDGIRTVTVDMCKKQAPGLGDYLVGLDPRWTWSEHLQHVLILCQTHVKRAFRKRFPDHEATAAIDLIWSANSKAEVIQIMDDVAEKWPETQKWFQNKKVDWILAGLTSEASKIPIDWWTNAPNHTGISESSHFHDNEAINVTVILQIVGCRGHSNLGTQVIHMIHLTQ
ncbi:hypothetical protein N7532_001510 [Penicillium argentinense]|uniref:Uncharacterized protein n=1 Tax=Penicillium argentinense TaxID=1131581 RepID=A0A9W9G3G5_9EURO|nr:uncharacterized protein N7532_001510 [Penicillium argentinense]KAJ5110975.1 hypothetical protein N7532_001510 [Penicillium argentinense]